MTDESIDVCDLGTIFCMPFLILYALFSCMTWFFGKLTTQRALVALVLILSASAGGVMGYSLNPSGDPTAWRGNPDFYNLLWQAILQIMATFCSFATAYRDGGKGFNHATSTLWNISFYTCASLSIASAILAPIAFVHFPGTGQTSSSATILNFSSTVFAFIPAVQIAASYNDDRVWGGSW